MRKKHATEITGQVAGSDRLRGYCSYRVKLKKLAFRGITDPIAGSDWLRGYSSKKRSLQSLLSEVLVARVFLLQSEA